jgi:hypothetical protein
MSKPSFDRPKEDPWQPTQQTPRKRKTAHVPQPNKNQKNRQAMTNAAPLYITVGPQCCGKSSLLKTLQDGKIKDISLDDQPDVYVPVSTDLFLSCFGDAQVPETLRKVYQGKSLFERIQNDNTELRLILQRWNGNKTSKDFENALQEFYSSCGFPLDVASQLVAAVEEFLDGQPPALPSTIDVFILESLFQPHPATNQSAIQKAHQELRVTPKHIPIAWGNTNSKSRDYSQALEIACQVRRPVRFVLCHPAISSEEKSQAANNAKLHTLPWIALPDLLNRNLKRLQETGRYIPAFAVADCCRRVESLVIINEVEGIDTVEKRLVSLASPPFMNGNKVGRHPQHQQRAPPFHFALTDQHLIQKIYPQTQHRPSGTFSRNTGIKPGHNRQGYPKKG